MDKRKLVVAFFVSVLINNLIFLVALVALLIDSSLGETLSLWKEALFFWTASVLVSTFFLYFWG